MRRVARWFVVTVLATILAKGASAQGLIWPGTGPIHRSMAGASTAAPLDAGSALYWNPAAISGLERSDVMLSGEMIYADTNLSSQSPVRGGGTLAGNTRSDSGLGILSGVAFVHRTEDSPLSFGLGMPAIVGGGVNFPGSPLNPALAPTGPLGRTVLGPMASNALIFQLTPTVSYQVTERLSIGAGPTADVAIVSFDPAYFAQPDDSNGDGLFTFPTATHSHPFWGGGFRVGAYYHVTRNIDAGFSYSSPQWFQVWKFNARDEIGRPETLYLNATLPAIYSWGLAYKGIERLVLALDFRLFDYKNTDLFGTLLRDGGLGWSDVFAVASGAQYRLSERISVRGGYLYNQNPLPDVGTFFNAQLPALIQHTLSVGMTYNVTEAVGLSLAYVHGFKASTSGSVLQDAGVQVGLDTQYDSLVAGLNFKYGGGTRTADADIAPVTIGTVSEVAPSESVTMPATAMPTAPSSAPRG